MSRTGRWFSRLSLVGAMVLPGSSALAQLRAASEEPAAARWTAIDDDESQRPSGADEIEEAAPSKASNDAPSEQDTAKDGATAGPQSVDDKASKPSPGLSEAAVDDDYSATEIIKERYADGSVQIEREVMQDIDGNYVNHGSWKMWDPAGRLVAQGEYRNNRRTGVWLRWYRNVAEAPLLSKMPYQKFEGPFVSQATFDDDKLDGTWTIFDGKLRKISQWRFADGKRTGNSLWWYPDGRKMRDVEYFDGELDGTALEWNSEGKLISSDTYQSGRRLGRKIASYPSGSKKSEGVYLFAKETEQSPDDWWNCKVLVTLSAGHDEKHGAWTAWHANGQRKLEGAYEHDAQVGPFTWWHSNRQKALEGRFEHGKQDGRWTWWFANGQKSIQGEYAHGNPTGHWTWWKQDGKVVQSADLSQSEGMVVDTPRLPNDNASRAIKPGARASVKR